MTFDVVTFLKDQAARVDLFMIKVLDTLTRNNPDWIDKLKKDKDLFNEDGSPKMDLSKETIDDKIKNIIGDSGFKGYTLTKEEIYKNFTLTPEDLDKYIIE